MFLEIWSMFFRFAPKKKLNGSPIFLLRWREHCFAPLMIHRWSISCAPWVELVSRYGSLRSAQSGGGTTRWTSSDLTWRRRSEVKARNQAKLTHWVFDYIIYDHKHTYFFQYDILFSVPVDNAPNPPPHYETMIELVRLFRKLHQIQKTQCQVKGLTICQKEAKC